MNTKAKRRILPVWMSVITLFSTIAAGCTGTQAPSDPVTPASEWADEMLFVDIDGDWPAIYLDDLSSKEAMLSRADFYFDYLFNGTHVTDVAVNCFEQSSLVPSDTMDWCHEKLAKYVAEHGPLNGYERVSDMWSKLYQALTEYQVDWYQEVLDRCGQAGVRTWMYLRMNDRHGINDSSSPFRDSFYSVAEENGYLIGNRREYGQDVAKQYDYAHPEVRDWMLAYIKEMLSRYDTFGLELDFMRRIECFDYLNNPDCADIMTQFIRDIRAAMDEAEAVRGHEIRLAVRIGPSVSDNLIYGFDAAEWAKEGLVDLIIASGHDDVADSEIDVTEWRNAVGEGVAVVPGFDMNLFNYPNFMTAEYVKGYAAGYYTKGCNGLYFENYYQLGSEGPYVWGLTRDAIMQGTRSYVRVGRLLRPNGVEPVVRYPIDLGETGDSGLDIDLCVGPVADPDRVTVTIGYQGEDPERLPSLSLDRTAYADAGAAEIPDDGITGRYLVISGNRTYTIGTAPCLAEYRFEHVKSDGTVTLHFDGSDHLIYYIEVTVEAGSPSE